MLTSIYTVYCVVYTTSHKKEGEENSLSSLLLLLLFSSKSFFFLLCCGHGQFLLSSKMSNLSSASSPSPSLAYSSTCSTQCNLIIDDFHKNKKKKCFDPFEKKGKQLRVEKKLDLVGWVIFLLSHEELRHDIIIIKCGNHRWSLANEMNERRLKINFPTLNHRVTHSMRVTPFHHHYALLENRFLLLLLFCSQMISRYYYYK